MMHYINNKGETSMITNEVFAISNKPGEVTLKGFNYIKELWWNPEYRLISIIYDSIMVFATI